MFDKISLTIAPKCYIVCDDHPQTEADFFYAPID